MGVGFVHGIAIIITGSPIIGGALGHWFGWSTIRWSAAAAAFAANDLSESAGVRDAPALCHCTVTAPSLHPSGARHRDPAPVAAGGVEYASTLVVDCLSEVGGVSLTPPTSTTDTSRSLGWSVW